MASDRPAPADPTVLAAEIHGEVSSALSALHEVLLDEGDSQEAWEDAAGSLASALDALVTRAIAPTHAGDEPTILDSLARCTPVTFWSDSPASGLNGRWWCVVCGQIAPPGAEKRDEAWHPSSCAWVRARGRAGVSPQPDDERCPFIVTTDDATSYCSLAASAGPAPQPPRTCPGCGAAPEVWVTASLHHPDASGRYGCNPAGSEVNTDGSGPIHEQVDQQALYDDVFTELSTFENYDGQDEAAGDALHDLTKRVLALTDRPQPEITRQQIAAKIRAHLAFDEPWTLEGVNAATDAVWALIADGATPAGPDDVVALRSIVRRVVEGWSLRIDNMDVIPPFWENDDGEVDLTPAERDALERVGATPAEDDQP